MSNDISDQAVFQLSKTLYTQLQHQINLKRLNLDDLESFKRSQIKPLYPHKHHIINGRKQIQKYTCSQSCFQLQPGSFCCCTTSSTGPQYLQFGLGTCMYVKFIKHISWLLFFVSLLSVLSITIYLVAAKQIGFNSDNSYNYALYSTTAGVLSSQYSKCQINSVFPNNNLPINAVYNLSCSVGQIKLISFTRSNQSIDNLQNCGLQSTKNSSYISQPSILHVTKTSPNTQSISIQYNSDSNNQNYLSCNYICQNGFFTLGGKQIPTKSFVYAAVFIDLLIVIMFIFFLCSQHCAQTKQIQNYHQRQLAVHDFTVKIKGFHYLNYQKQLQQFIQNYNQIRNRHPMESSPPQRHFIHNIVQIKLPQKQQVRQVIDKRRQCYQEMEKLITQTFIDDQIDITKYNKASDWIKKCFGNNKSFEYMKYKKQLNHLIVKFLQSKNIKYKSDIQDNQMTILMTLTNPKHKRQMIKRAKGGCFGHSLKVNSKKYYVSEPPIADMVLWQNKNKNTLIRVLISWLITFAICFGSYLLVGFAVFSQQVQLQSNRKFSQNCELNYSSAELNTFDSTKSSQNSDYLHCYCNNNYFKWIAQNSQLRSACSQWFKGYIIYQAIPFLISFGILIYNLIVSRIFRILTKFQANKQLSTQLYSYIIKRAFILIMNMGLVVILLKMNYHPQKINNFQDFSYLFNGVYTDVTSGWYFNIGVIIILTLLLNILIPIFDMLFVSFLKCMRRCLDTTCYCRKTSQKTKKSYLQLYSNDIFPIQERYAEFIALIIIVLTFSAVMPFLYIIAFASIWFMFICDKLLLFRVYQKPINFSKDLQQNVFIVVYISIMVHCVVSPFLLSQPHLMQAAGYQPQYSRFASIIKTMHLMPYVIIFLLLAFWAIFYSTIVKFCAYLANKCQIQLGRVYKSKYHQNFYHALNQYQLSKLKQSMQLQLCTTSLHKIKIDTIPQASIIKRICQNTIKTLNLTQPKKQQLAQNNEKNNQQTIKLIGKVGYQEILDDQVFQRQKKIKLLDHKFTAILQKQVLELSNYNNQRQQATISSINQAINY